MDKEKKTLLITAIVIDMAALVFYSIMFFYIVSFIESNPQYESLLSSAYGFSIIAAFFILFLFNLFVATVIAEKNRSGRIKRKVKS